MQSLITNLNRKFRDGFDTFTTDDWEITEQDASDIIEIDGNTNGSSYLKIVKDPRVANSKTEIRSRTVLEMPAQIGAGLSISQRIAGQDTLFGVAAVVESPANSGMYSLNKDDPYTDIVATSISQSTTTLTVNVPVGHGLVPGDRVNIIGCVDSRLNYQSLLVASIPSTTQFTATATTYGALPSVTVSPAGTPTVRKIGYGNRLKNYLAVLADGTSSTNGILSRRRNSESEQKTAATGLASAWSAAIVPSSPITYNTTGAYAFNPGAILEFKMCSTSAVVGTTFNNSSSIGVYPSSWHVTENIPDEGKKYSIVARVANLDSMTTPTAKIVSATKAGTTTATIVTDAAHGLTVNDFVMIYGIADQTNFANLTTATQVASIVDATTFTIAFGASFTGTARGGAVFRINGGSAPAALGQVITNIQSSGGIVTLTGNASWSGIAIGEHLCIHGARDATTGANLGLDGIYKVLGQSTTIMTCVAAKTGQVIPTLGSTACGGAVIKTTDVRLHFVRALDYTRTIVEVEPGLNRGSPAYALPVNVGNTVSVTSSSITLVPSTTAGGASTLHHLISAATTNATSVKASAGMLNNCIVSNNGAAVAYIKLYNKASAPTVGTDIPVLTALVPVNGTISLELGAYAERFTTGIAYAITGGMAVADVTAVAANQVAVHMSYL